MRCFGRPNYGIFVAALTALIVILIGITGVAAGTMMVARRARILSRVRKSAERWRRNLVPERLADLFDAHCAYFEATCGRITDRDALFYRLVDLQKLVGRNVPEHLSNSARPGYFNGANLRFFCQPEVYALVA